MNLFFHPSARSFLEQSDDELMKIKRITRHASCAEHGTCRCLTRHVSTQAKGTVKTGMPYEQNATQIKNLLSFCKIILRKCLQINILFVPLRRKTNR